MQKVVLILLFFPFSLCGEFSKREQAFISDIGQLACIMPGTVLNYTNGDHEGNFQLASSVVTTLASTFLLKYLTQEKRPFGNTFDSFPSAHTSSAFAGAGFITKRYGLAYGLPALSLAALVGYLRLTSGWHYSHDVYCGATIGILCSFTCTKAIRF